LGKLLHLKVKHGYIFVKTVIILWNYRYIKSETKIPKYDELLKEQFHTLLQKEIELTNSKIKLTEEEDKQLKYAKELRLSYAKKFMAQSIYYAKTPSKGYERLISMYIEAYKVYFGENEFEKYKQGIIDLLKVNVQFGFIEHIQMNNIVNKMKLETRRQVNTQDNDEQKKLKEAADANTQSLLATKKEKNEQKDLRRSKRLEKKAQLLCKTPSNPSRKKRSANSSPCIVLIRKGDSSNVNNDASDIKGQVKYLEVESIDSKQLSNYLLIEQTTGSEIANNKQHTNEYLTQIALQNKDKLSGTEKEITLAKTLIDHNQLVSHATQNELARGIISGPLLDLSQSNLENMRIGMSRVTSQSSKFVSEVNKVGNVYGKTMLAKSIVSAIRNGDEKTLVIISARVGLDYGMEGVQKLGGYLATKSISKTATRVGSRLLKIGKLAGPIGAVADIGLSIWSISKSVEVLRNPIATKYDQNDAIADIIADSIDIVVTSVAAISYAVFPPAGPVVSAIAFGLSVATTLIANSYKAYNHVNRISDKIPLLDYEKSEEGFRYFTFRDTSMYIEELKHVKNANNLVVNISVDFLQLNSDFIGMVFPARSLKYPKGKCYLEKEFCLHFLFGLVRVHCSGWQSVSECEGPGGECHSVKERCKGNDRIILNSRALFDEFVAYKCNCGEDAAPEWGYEISDSIVDLRQTQSVYLQRSSPDLEIPPDYDYICKPSSKEFEGDRISQQDTSVGYLCHGAIGIKKLTEGGKAMFFDLKDGADYIHVNPDDITNNLFVVGDGMKYFEGGAGDDTFLINGTCEYLVGLLDGKGKQDVGNSLVFSDTCAQDIRISVQNSSVLFNYTNYFLLSFENIERFVGRKGRPEHFRPSCSVEFINGQGGGDDFDEIVLPECMDENFQCTIFCEGTTKIEFQQFVGGNIHIVLSKFSQFVATEVPTETPKPSNIIFQFLNSNAVLKKIEQVSISSFLFTFSDSNTAQFSFSTVKTTQNQTNCSPAILLSYEVLLEQNNTQYRMTYSDETNKWKSLILVNNDRSVNETMYGLKFVSNIFDIKNDLPINLVGGDHDDQFQIPCDFSGTIQGTKGTNTVYFTGISFEKTASNWYKVRNSTFKSFDIQNYIGKPNIADEITCGCETELIDLNGGTDSVRDKILVPNLVCNDKKSQLTIIVSGKTRVEYNSKESRTVVVVGKEAEKSKCEQVPSKTDLEVLNYGEGLAIVVKFPVSSLSFYSQEEEHIDFRDSENHKIRITGHGKLPFVSFEEPYGLTSVLIQQGDEGFAMLHELKDYASSRLGCKVVQNFFKLISGNWSVTGGQKSDTFFLESDNFEGSIDGSGGNNSLVLGDNVVSNMTIDFSESRLVHGSRVILVSNVQLVYGRSTKQEHVTCACETSYICLNGGDDVITVPYKDCNYNVKILAKGKSKYKNNGSKGSFEVHIEQDSTGNLHFEAEVHVNPHNTHIFPIQIPAYKLSDYTISFNSREMELNLFFGNDLSFKLLAIFESIDDKARLLTDLNVLFLNDNVSDGYLYFSENDLQIIHTLEKYGLSSIKRGAVGAKNIFRCNSGNYLVHGGKYGDTFILNSDLFTGQINGYGGVNSLILTNSLANSIAIDLPNKTFQSGLKKLLEINGIQIVSGRRGSSEKVVCNCDTKLIALEGGNSDQWDQIIVPKSYCLSQNLFFVVDNFTRVKNEAQSGEFNYHIKGSEFEIAYEVSNRSYHFFKFEMSLEEFEFMELNDSNLTIEFTSGLTKFFPINGNHTKFQIAQTSSLITDLTLEYNHLQSVITYNSCTGSVRGISGVMNSIVLRCEENTVIESVLGCDKDDKIFIVGKVDSIWEIDGGAGLNSLTVGEDVWIGAGLEYSVEDKHNGAISFINSSDTKSDKVYFVYNLKNIQLLTGRQKSYDKIKVGCETKEVINFDLILFSLIDCEYNIHIDVGESTQVQFVPELNNDLLEDDNQNDDEFDTTDQFYESEEDKLFYDTDVEFFEGEFLYKFSTVRSFDIEVENFVSLWNTRHYFSLNFTLSDFSTVYYSSNSSRLIYSIHSSPLTFTHKVFLIEDSGMLYFQPEFITADGFLIRITRYGEIVVSFGNLEQVLELQSIQTDLLPEISSFASSFGVTVMIETKNQFVYCGNENETNILSNRDMKTSHLVGFNQTTYVIFNSSSDVYIYPMKVTNSSLHVIDLSNIVIQIRNITKTKYIPNVVLEGEDLVLIMSEFENLFPLRVVIVGGVYTSHSIRVLLNTIVMELVRLDNGTNLITKRMVHNSESNIIESLNVNLTWILKPRPIEIQPGQTILLSGEDLEDGVEIWDASNKTFVYSQEQQDLLVTSIGEHDPGNESTLIVSDFFSLKSRPTETGFGDVETANEIKISLGNKTVVYSSAQQSFVDEKGNVVQLVYYEDVLEKRENDILLNHFIIPKRFQVSIWRKIMRDWTYKITFLCIIGCTFTCVIIFCCKRPFKRSRHFKPRKQSHSKRTQTAENEQVTLLTMAKLDDKLSN